MHSNILRYIYYIRGSYQSCLLYYIVFLCLFLSFAQSDVVAQQCVEEEARRERGEWGKKPLFSGPTELGRARGREESEERRGKQALSNDPGWKKY